MSISIEFNTSEKLRALIGQIDKLLLSDFAHPATESALRTIRAFFEGHVLRIKRAAASPEPSLLNSACATVNERIYQYLPVLGFLLRSTHVRNSFEVYDLLLGYAKKLIANDAQFVMSSEWDFSPLTYAMTVSALPRYVMVGLPSSESGNALIIPLAGHELGHSVWVNLNLETEYSPRIEASLKDCIRSKWSEFRNAFPEHAQQGVPKDISFKDDIFLSQNLESAARLAQSQVEEIFCDAVGLSLFGMSYAYAFHYLLAPNVGTERTPDYPPLIQRARYMGKYGIAELRSERFEEQFSTTQSELTSRDALLLQVADDVSELFAEELYRRAADHVKAHVPRLLPNEKKQAAILIQFEDNVPADGLGSLADILNAGWSYVHANRNEFKEGDASIVSWISELILKSAEVLEFRERTKRV